MKENIKIGLLGVIALTLIINTFFTETPPSKKEPRVKTPNQSNIAATPNSQSGNTPITIPNKTQPTPTVKLSESRAKTAISFEEMNHDFGTILQESKNTKIFKFTNTGLEPLIIEDAKGSCGCTVPKFPKEPILPGKTGEIEVVYSPGKQKGVQNKNVTITANTEPINTIINISANVEIP